MNVVLWIITVALALVFLTAGTLKILQPRAKLVAMGVGMDYVEDFSDGAIITIGVVEVLAALGLVLPPLIRISSLSFIGVLVPVAAIGLVGLMFGAAVVHARRNEFRQIRLNLVLFTVAFIVIWGRLGPYHFNR